MKLILSLCKFRLFFEIYKNQQDLLTVIFGTYSCLRTFTLISLSLETLKFLHF